MRELNRCFELLEFDNTRCHSRLFELLARCKSFVMGAINLLCCLNDFLDAMESNDSLAMSPANGDNGTFIVVQVDQPTNNLIISALPYLMENKVDG